MPKIKLNAARVNAGLTQKEAAEKLGISVSTLKNWESGKTFPRQPQIDAICSLYGVKFDVLFFNTTLA